MINKILILILILGFNTQISAEIKGLTDDLSGELSPVEAVNTNERKLLVENKDTEIEEELPAVSPFLGGASSSSGQNNTNTESSQNGSLLNNLKLVGIIKGEGKNKLFVRTANRSIKYVIELLGDLPIDVYSSKDASKFRDYLLDRGLLI